MFEHEYFKDRIRGSLIGGAIGDALGYPVEFMKTYKGYTGEVRRTRYHSADSPKTETG